MAQRRRGEVEVETLVNPQSLEDAWSGLSDASLVMMMSPQCGYCVAFADDFRRLAQQLASPSQHPLPLRLARFDGSSSVFREWLPLQHPEFFQERRTFPSLMLKLPASGERQRTIENFRRLWGNAEPAAAVEKLIDDWKHWQQSLPPSKLVLISSENGRELHRLREILGLLLLRPSLLPPLSINQVADPQWWRRELHRLIDDPRLVRPVDWRISSSAVPQQPRPPQSQQPSSQQRQRQPPPRKQQDGAVGGRRSPALRQTARSPKGADVTHSGRRT